MTPITIYDIAKEANVSVSTVSRVLNDTAPVRASTREKVMAIIEKHQFQPNALARSLIKKETGTIAIILPDITNPFFPEVFWGAENEARDKGYTFFLCNTGGDHSRESEYLTILREKRVDGIIFLGGRINLQHCPEEMAQELIEAGKHLPIVLVNGNIAKSGLHRIYTDEAAGAVLATQHLLDLGHREIAFVGGLKEMATTMVKVKAIQKKLKEHGLEIPKERLLLGDFSIDSGKEQMARLLEQQNPPTAVICVNDYTAIGAIKATIEHGLSIPGDISIVGYDDTPLASAVIPELTTVSQNTYQLGKLAVDLLHDLIGGGKTKKQTALQPELIIRQSTGPARR
ncbi:MULTISPECIES: LacI family DNA-binding transcriptional regulator [Paenibacillus]|uniref:LacI family transcriptional regulator/LacI family purine nucleotide synthesis repressor n=1 Tax=Paenibacillus favisporus TaxID=221028 RepID=A0ABV2F293_9BACL|nr:MULTISPECIES: LacI family DNA-binding transcriptional regulator [Paenibacillus]MCM2997152.1 LacI family transcriptional regulator [Paenibacillus cellulositrophicus]RED41660.1 LacI family transcriptional regulator [Paenibacillus sp. VMFN-D1]